MRALLLAAGYGTRLKPLTDHVPKPLTLFMGRPILDLVYEKVRAAGLREVAVNTHHLPERISQHIQNSALYRQPIHLSHEPEILGTGGSLNPLRPWLGREDLLIFNGDILTTLDLAALASAYEGSGAIAAMVLLPHKAGTTPVYLKEGRVVGIGEAVAGAVKRTFAGVHILSEGFVAAVPKSGFLSVIDTYKALLTEHKVLGFEHEGYWADLGIPGDYFEAHEALWQSPDRMGVAKALHLDPESWCYDARQESVFIDGPVLDGFRRSYVFGPVASAAGLSIERCLVYPGTEVTKHDQARDKILTPYASLSFA